MITLINPVVVSQKNDVAGTGIPYMPISLASVAAVLRENKIRINVIDAFGANPFKVRKVGNFFYQGLTIPQILLRTPRSDLIVIYANHTSAHNFIIRLIKKLKQRTKGKIAILENTQAVTAYSLLAVKDEFLDAGADYLITGEGEYRTVDLYKNLKHPKKLKKLDGIIGEDFTNIAKKQITNLDKIPLPAWDLFPLRNYWRLKYSHGPLSSTRYLPLLTSKGCIFNCNFCVTPATNKNKWRARSAENVVDEITYLYQRFGVREFHVEDLNPTVDKKRMVEISRLILKRNLNIIWKICSGTKAETLDKEIIHCMARAGCKYISISPESGSKRLLKLMNKSFDHKHGLEIVNFCKKVGIYTQGCFVIGFPGENQSDRIENYRYAKELARAGLDEIAIFIITPIPGSKIYDQFSKKYLNISQLTFSPTWRNDYKELSKDRWNLFLYFSFWKLIHHPIDSISQLSNLFSKFNTKSEMTIYRLIKIRALAR